MARRTRARVFSLTVGSALTTRETVFAETSASAATSSSVAGCCGFVMRNARVQQATHQVLGGHAAEPPDCRVIRMSSKLTPKGPALSIARGAVTELSAAPALFRQASGIDRVFQAPVPAAANVSVRSSPVFGAIPQRSAGSQRRARITGFLGG